MYDLRSFVRSEKFLDLSLKIVDRKETIIGIKVGDIDGAMIIIRRRFNQMVLAFFLYYQLK